LFVTLLPEAHNKRLIRAIGAALVTAEVDSWETGKPARHFQDLTWSTRRSWSRKQRVIAKAEWTHGAANPRFIVTSLDQVMRANQLRLWFASMAHLLLESLRRLGLPATELANATCGAAICSKLALLSPSASAASSLLWPRAAPIRTSSSPRSAPLDPTTHPPF
jgi:Transposase DDE domain group 1